jgi:folate-binding protein YgfZ
MNWQKVFPTFSAVLDEKYPGRIISFGETPHDYGDLSSKSVLSADLRAFIQLRGPDSEKFLQGQVSCDLSKLEHDQSMKGAHLSPKGRIIFLFIATKDHNNDFLLEIHPSVLRIAIDSLKKYSVFFKTEIVDVSHNYETVILSGVNNKAILKHFKPFQSCAIGPSAISIRLSKNYYLDQLTKKNLDLIPAGQGYSDLLRIESGSADITSSTTDKFIVQMINLDAQDYISFKKGCYTGQEIVARAHYRGKVKRRMYLMELDTIFVPKLGDDLFDSDGKVIGTAAGAAIASSTSVKVLAVLSVKAENWVHLKFNGTDLINITHCALPYTIDK